MPAPPTRAQQTTIRSPANTRTQTQETRMGGASSSGGGAQPARSQTSNTAAKGDRGGAGVAGGKTDSPRTTVAKSTVGNPRGPTSPQGVKRSAPTGTGTSGGNARVATGIPGRTNSGRIALGRTPESPRVMDPTRTQAQRTSAPGVARDKPPAAYSATDSYRVGNILNSPITNPNVARQRIAAAQGALDAARRNTAFPAARPANPTDPNGLQQPNTANASPLDIYRTANVARDAMRRAAVATPQQSLAPPQGQPYAPFRNDPFTVVRNAPIAAMRERARTQEEARRVADRAATMQGQYSQYRSPPGVPDPAQDYNNLRAANEFGLESARPNTNPRVNSMASLDSVYGAVMGQDPYGGLRQYADPVKDMARVPSDPGRVTTSVAANSFVDNLGLPSPAVPRQPSTYSGYGAPASPEAMEQVMQGLINAGALSPGQVQTAGIPSPTNAQPPSQEYIGQPNVAPSQNAGQPQSLQELANRYNYEKGQIKQGFQNLPGQIYDAIVGGDFKPFAMTGLQGQGGNRAVDRAPQQQPTEQASADSISSMIAFLQDAGVTNPNDQLALILRTFV
jgi:hypothetical protein